MAASARGEPSSRSACARTSALRRSPPAAAACQSASSGMLPVRKYDSRVATSQGVSQTSPAAGPVLSPDSMRR
jgi:hypothetical protein